MNRQVNYFWWRDSFSFNKYEQSFEGENIYVLRKYERKIGTSIYVEKN